MAPGDGDDSFGVLAALALLSVHVVEAVEAPSGDPITLLEVSSDALSMRPWTQSSRLSSPSAKLS